LHNPLSVEKQVAILYCGTHGLLSDIPLNRVKDFETNFLTLLDFSYKEKVLDEIRKGNFDDSISKLIEEAAQKVKTQLK
jgi:F-type H+-transporting ATPase subunit alpha